MNLNRRRKKRRKKSKKLFKRIMLPTISGCDDIDPSFKIVEKLK
jgi:hypothetical protein